MNFYTAVFISVLCLLVAAILGGLIVYFMLRNRILSLKEEISQLQNKLEQQRKDCEQKTLVLNQEINSHKDALEQSIQEKESLELNIQAKQKELESLKGDHQAILIERDQLKGREDQQKAAIAKLQGQIDEQKDQLELLGKRDQKSLDDYKVLDKKYQGLETQLKEAQAHVEANQKTAAEASNQAKEFKALEKKYQDLEKELKAAQELTDANQITAAKASNHAKEFKALEKKYQDLEKELKAARELADANQKAAAEAGASSNVNILALQKEQSNLKKKYQLVVLEYERSKSQLKIAEKYLAQMNQKNQDLLNSQEIGGEGQAALAKIEDKYRAEFLELQGEFTQIQQKLEEREKEFKKLQSQRSTKVDEPKPTPAKTPAKSSKKAAPKLSKEEKKAQALEKIKEKAQAFDYSNMGVATAEQKDDLKLIKGVGPFIEEKLNALNIFVFAQIAKFSEQDVEQVTTAIEFFPGRIQRDNWITQAKELAEKKQKGEL